MCRYLRLIKTDLATNGWRSLQLDGKLNINQRQEVLETFATDPSVHVLLLSMRAAGVGLNIVSANHVFLMGLYSFHIS
jgi:SNF2 family DNA or RNA helicase